MKFLILATMFLGILAVVLGIIVLSDISRYEMTILDIKTENERLIKVLGAFYLPPDNLKPPKKEEPDRKGG